MQALLFPAHAGMNRNMYPFGYGPIPVPRTRGDEPRIEADRRGGPRCSPHTRG